jgi:hypothetical protein
VKTWLVGSPAASGGFAPEAEGGAQQVFYTGTDLDIRRLGLTGDETPHPQDLMIASGGAPRAVGDPISHVFTAEGTQHLFYATGERHIIELWWQGD